MCGKNDQGQLGLGNYNNELVPYYVTRISDKVSEVACGEAHTLLATSNGQLFSMG
jgi:alpha-tubulin suppressor-like RCC1 family protein